MWQRTLGLLGLETPQKRARAVPLQRGVLKQSEAALPHLVLMFLYWQLSLQQEDPAKNPVPGSHCSPTSLMALPQTGGTVTEEVPELEGVTEGVPVPVPVPVPETD